MVGPATLAGLLLAGFSPVAVIVVGGLAEGVVEASGQVAGIAAFVTSLAFVGIAASRVSAADDPIEALD